MEWTKQGADATELLTRLEKFIDEQLQAITGQPASRLYQKRTEKPQNPTKCKLKRQPWYDDDCTACKRRWKRLCTTGAPVDAISAAKR